MLPWAVGPLSNRAPQYQNQYTLVNRDGKLRLAARSRRVLALPPEILGEIFFFCLPFDKNLLVTPDPHGAPLVLCKVCRQWRSIALATPKLWSSIYFESEEALPESAALYVDFCRDWISRAGSTPLSFWLHANASDPAVDSLLQIISGVSQQWQNIDIRDLPLSFPADRKYPLLEKLNLSPSSDHPVLSFCDAPRLRDVFISEYTTRIQLPWHQLTKFGTLSMRIEACLDLLRHASNLAEAHLRISPYGASALPDTIFSLPQLHYLNLSVPWVDDEYTEMVEMPMMPMTLLKCLKTPALKALALGFEYTWNDDLVDISPFLAFVSQSSFHLHALTLSVIPTTTDALMDCLKATPSVIRLKLHISPSIVDMDPVFAEFTGHDKFLPNLESLQISLWPRSPTQTVDASLVVNMLIWRCVTSRVARLRSFWLAVLGKRELEESIKCYIEAHPVFPELEALGTELRFGERNYLLSFMDVS
jgi:hypothetical protein